MEFIPLHFGDRLTVINPQGTIGVVTLWSRVDYVTARFLQAGMDLSEETSPIAVFGTLYGNGLRELLRNLLYNPQIRVLLICGHDRSDSRKELLLFEVGLESSVAEMRTVGLSSFLVAIVGIIAPFFLGYWASSIFITEIPRQVLAMNANFDITNIHIFIGATLCATSVGITARVLKDLGKLQIKEAKIVLGAAVIDDVMGLIILAVAAGIIVAAETGVAMHPLSIVSISAIAIGFLVGAIVVGLTVVPRIIKRLAVLRTRGVMLISALLFCFIFAYMANLAGLAAIVGAFAAGLILEEVHFKEFQEERHLHELLAPVTTFLVPVFFVVMGIQVRLETFLNGSGRSAQSPRSQAPRAAP